MRTAHKYVIIGVSVALGLGGATAAVAQGKKASSTGATGSASHAYTRYIDAGNTSAAIPAGKRTWEAQAGFAGGTVHRTRRPGPGRLPQSVAQTLLTGPSAFSLEVPDGAYRVSLWALRTGTETSVAAENGSTTTVTALPSRYGRHGAWTRVSVSVKVTDGSLDLAFGPAPSGLVVAALAIEGRAAGGPVPTTPQTSVTTPPAATPSITMPPVSVTRSPTTPPPATTTKEPTQPPPPAAEPSPNKACTKPVFTTSDSNGGWSTNGYYVHNNMWNTSEAGPEKLSACAFDNWYVTSTQADSTSVKTFPNVHKDYDNVPISSFNSLKSTFAATSPHTGIYDVAYDIWLNGVASAGSSEMMIWTDNYKQQPSGSVVATVDLSGKTWDVWWSSQYHYLAFVPKKVLTSGSLDLLAMMKWSISKGYLKASSTVGQIGYGIEICSTNNKPATFQVTDFAITSS